MMPTISIAMATFNGGRYLGDQLSSILRQTRLPDELVVCDDGSSDHTADIVRRFACDAPFPVKFSVNESRLGYKMNFERALRMCEGDLLALSDQDDYWLPDKLKLVEGAFRSTTGTMVVVNDQYIADRNLNINGVTGLQNTKRLGFTDAWYVAGCCTTIRREFLDVLLPFPSFRIGHDSWISIIADALGARVLVPVPLQKYRRHGGNTSASLASVTRPVSRFDVLRRYGLIDVSNEWLQEIQRLSYYQARLRQRESVAHSLSLNVDEAIDVFRRRQRHLEKRMALLVPSRIRRAPGLLAFWWGGGYESASGWQSLVKDLLRPCDPDAGQRNRVNGSL